MHYIISVFLILFAVCYIDAIEQPVSLRRIKRGSPAATTSKDTKISGNVTDASHDEAIKRNKKSVVEAVIVEKSASPKTPRHTSLKSLIEKPLHGLFSHSKPHIDNNGESGIKSTDSHDAKISKPRSYLPSRLELPQKSDLPYKSQYEAAPYESPFFELFHNHHLNKTHFGKKLIDGSPEEKLQKLRMINDPQQSAGNKQSVFNPYGTDLRSILNNENIPKTDIAVYKYENVNTNNTNSNGDVALRNNHLNGNMGNNMKMLIDGKNNDNKNRFNNNNKNNMNERNSDVHNAQNDKNIKESMAVVIKGLMPPTSKFNMNNKQKQQHEELSKMSLFPVHSDSEGNIDDVVKGLGNDFNAQQKQQQQNPLSQCSANALPMEGVENIANVIYRISDSSPRAQHAQFSINVNPASLFGLNSNMDPTTDLDALDFIFNHMTPPKPQTLHKPISMPLLGSSTPTFIAAGATGLLPHSFLLPPYAFNDGNQPLNLFQGALDVLLSPENDDDEEIELRCPIHHQPNKKSLDADTKNDGIIQVCSCRLIKKKLA